MNIYQESILGQARSIVLFSKAYGVSLDLDVLVKPRFERIQQICTELTVLSAKQDRSGKALTDQKNLAMGTVIDLCVVCADYMKSYGCFMHLSMFANIEGCNRNQLMRERGEEVLKHAHKLIDVMDEFPEQTIASGVSDELKLNLTTVLDEATIVFANPKTFRSDHREMTELMDSLLNEYKDLINNSLRSYMRSKYLKSMPDLYAAFLNSLKIDAIPKRKRVLTGHFTNVTGEAVRLVYVSIDGQKAISKGGDKGGYFIQNLTAGQHEIVFNRKGYQVERRTVMIIPGETLELNIEFTPVQIINHELAEV